MKAGVIDFDTVVGPHPRGASMAGRVQVGPAKAYTTRRPSQSSKNSNWLHAVGFVVLVAIVISWALGY